MINDSMFNFVENATLFVNDSLRSYLVFMPCPIANCQSVYYSKAVSQGSLSRNISSVSRVPSSGRVSVPGYVSLSDQRINYLYRIYLKE